MIVAGPYSILSTPAVNYAADITNLTCALNNYTITLVLGPELMLWCVIGAWQHGFAM